jgi:hypothetical protein
MKRNRILVALLALLLAAGASCNDDDGGKVLVLRVDARTGNMPIGCVDELEITFGGTGDTRITGSSSGTWKEGVTYGTEAREGATVFVIYVSGDYIREEITKNGEILPHQFDLPLRGVGGSGTFKVGGAWRYKGVDTGLVRESTLQLPDADSFFIVTIQRHPDHYDDPCLTAPPDADVTPEEVEEVAEQEGGELDLADIETAPEAEPEEVEETPDEVEVQEAD